jgi:hypothetical protein
MTGIASSPPGIRVPRISVSSIAWRGTEPNLANGSWRRVASTALRTSERSRTTACRAAGWRRRWKHGEARRVHGGVRAGDHEAGDQGDELGAAQAIAGLLGADRVAEQVAAEAAPAILDHLEQGRPPSRRAAPGAVPAPAGDAQGELRVAEVIGRLAVTRA